jgi:hypothetical protein
MKLERVLAVALMAFMRDGAWKSSTASLQLESAMPTYVSVSYCDLVRRPYEYDGKGVAVWATYRYGFEWQELFCVKCRGDRKTWLEFVEMPPDVHRALSLAPRHEGTLNATFQGTFRGTGGPFGDGGYAFGFDVRSVRGIEVVSRKGWAPQRLSTAEQGKLCQGEGASSHVGERE